MTPPKEGALQYDSKYLIATAERATKTFFQTLLALLGTDAVGLLTADWGQALSVAAAAAVLSIITSLSSAGFGAPGPSLVNESIHPETVIVEVPAAPKRSSSPKAKAPARKAPAKRAAPTKR
jgi:serine acetyltransferase